MNHSELNPASADDESSTSKDEQAVDRPTPLPAEEMTPQELAEAKEYGRKSLFYSLVDMGLDLAFLLVLALLLARPLDDWLSRSAWLAGGDIFHRTVRLAALYLISLGLHVAISLPLSFYRGFVMEHAYGLSNQSLWRWSNQYAKRLALTMVANLIMLAGLFWIMWLLGPYWWIMAAVAFFVVTIVLGYIAPILILPIFLKYERLDDEQLTEEIRHLAEGTGLHVEGVYRLNLSADTKKANAMLAGLGSTRRVLLGDTLLDSFTTDEIKVVMAHEIGHHVYRHIYKMILLAVPYSLASYWVCDLVLALWIGKTYDPSQLPIYAMPMLMLLMFVLAVATGPLSNALMRHFERQCDRYALDRTGLAAAYRSAFTKLARLNKADPDPHPLEVMLFDDHPPIAERLAMADEK